jgi:hypothetical protein
MFVIKIYVVMPAGYSLQIIPKKSQLNSSLGKRRGLLLPILLASVQVVGIARHSII